jgi:hypothetical protein
MKSFIVLLGLVLVFYPKGVDAQTTTANRAQVPVTKILAIGTLVGELSTNDRASIMPKEVKETVGLYLQGKIDQWWYRQDGKGVIFLLNVISTDEATAMLEKLPLGVAGKMTFQLMPLGPLAPLKYLMAPMSQETTHAH